MYLAVKKTSKNYPKDTRRNRINFGFLAFLFICLLPLKSLAQCTPNFGAAVSFTSTAATAATTLTVSGTNTLLLAQISIQWPNATAISITSATCKGVAMTPKLKTIDATNHVTLETWYVNGPATGANPVTITLSAAPTRMHTGVLYYSNTTGLGASAAVTAQATSTFHSISLNTNSANSLVNGLCFQGSGTKYTITSTTGQTRRWEEVATSRSTLGDDKPTTNSGAYSMGYTFSTTAVAELQAYEILSGGCSPTPTPTNTLTATPTPTITLSPTDSLTPTVTFTPSLTPTATPTPTSTSTATAIPCLANYSNAGSTTANIANAHVSFALNTLSASSLLVVQVEINNSTATDTVNLCTYGGTPLTQIFDVQDNTNHATLEEYYMENPPTGSANVAVSIAQSLSRSLNVGAFLYTGALPSVSSWNYSTSLGPVSNKNQSINITTLNQNSHLLGFCAAVTTTGDTISASGANQTQHWIQNPGAVYSAEGDDNNPNGAPGVYTSNYILGTAALADMALLEIVPANCPPTSTFTVTNSPTSTKTSTMTSTPTYTPTLSPTVTSTPTATPTVTFTPTKTPPAAWNCLSLWESGDTDPWGAAEDSAGTYLYVADGANSTVDVFSVASGSAVTSWSVPGGSNGASSPFGIAVDGSEKVYVTDSNNNLVDVSWGYGTSHAAGSSNVQWGGTLGFNNPYGIAVNSAGTTVYVADNNNSRVVLLDNTGALNKQFGGPTDHSPVTFTSPTGLALDAGGDIYVGDDSTQQVYRFNGKGTALQLQIDTSNGLSGIEFLSLGSTGGVTDIYVSDGAGEVGLYNNITGGVIGITTQGTSGAFTDAEGVAADSNGNWFAVDNNNSLVYKFNMGNCALTPLSTFTGTPTNTKTPTPTPTATPTYTTTYTPTATLTNTQTSTSTSTQTATPTNSQTATSSNTQTDTTTNTQTATSTHTQTATPTDSPTVTATSTQTTTPTDSPTATQTSTLTDTVTNTPTFTQTSTSTSTSTDTQTFTSTNTVTDSPTITPTSTATFTVTDSPTVTSTSTSTYTVTNFPTVTDTPTSTVTSTNTLTVTDTPTFTITDTFTSTNSPTVTSTSTLTPNPSVAGCGYLADGGGVSAPLATGVDGNGTTYIYTTVLGSGEADFTVVVPSSGAYKMTATAGSPLYSMDVTGHVGGTSTRYWNLNAGEYVVSWTGRYTHCDLSCFNLVKVSDSFMPTATPIPTGTATPVGTLPAATSTPNPNPTPGTDLHDAWYVTIQGVSDTNNYPTQYFVVLPLATATPTATSTLTPNPTGACGYLADGSGVASPLAVGVAGDGTTYIYSTTGAGSQNYTVNIPVSGTYKMSASVSAPSASSNSWNVQIQGVMDNTNYGNQYFVVQTLKTALHTEDVNGHIGGTSTRYWNLNAGNYVVTWGGRSANCALACFSLVRTSTGFFPTPTFTTTKTLTPTTTPTFTPSPNQGHSSLNGDVTDETPTVSATSTGTPWTGPEVVAAPNISSNGTPIQFRVNLKQSTEVHLILYSILGEQVYTATLQGQMGLNQIEWDLANASGTQVASGLYIYQVRVGVMAYSGKVVVIH